MNKCKTCDSTEKTLFVSSTSYYKGRKYQSYSCKECHLEYFRKWRKTKRGKAISVSAVIKSQKKYPEKTKARILLNRAVSLGFLLKPSGCSLCGSLSSVEAHHEDYSKPLEVIWLCRKCHAETHKNAKAATMAA